MVFNCSLRCPTALCVHVSRETKEILDNLGGFKLESRGEVEIKVNVWTISPLLDKLKNTTSNIQRKKGVWQE